MAIQNRIVDMASTLGKPQTHLNNMAGINAGKGLQKNGIQLMRSLMWPWQKVPGAKRLYYESALHKALEIGNASGPIVSGDVVPTENWPAEFQGSLATLVE